MTPTHAGGEVLIVEDDQGCRDLITEVVRDAGYPIVVCDRVEDALRHLDQSHPRLVVLDVMLPDGDGFAILDRLRNNPATQVIPVLLCTAALFEVSAQQQALVGPYTDLVYKPFHIQSFVTAMNRLLGRPARRQPDA
jgi:DNA-binding response OmpR family regulator